MLNSALLDAIAGLSFVFFIVALACSAAVEAVANLVKKRAKYLLRGLQAMLDSQARPDPTPPPTASPVPAVADRAPAVPDGVTASQRFRDLMLQPQKGRQEERRLYQDALDVTPSITPQTDQRAPGPNEPTTGTTWTMRVMGHPLVAPFKNTRVTGEKTRNPSYLPAGVFASALLDILTPGGSTARTFDAVGAAVDGLGDDIPAKAVLRALVKTAGDDLETFRTSLERWYDAQMDRVGGAYKRWAKRWIIVFAIAVAGFLQVDSIAIAKALYNDGPLRSGVVAAAANKTLCEPSEAPNATQDCVTRELKALQATGIPIGWSAETRPEGVEEWATKILGLGLTAWAASFGAPFWFGALNRIAPLRNTGRKPSSEA